MTANIMSINWSLSTEVNTSFGSIPDTLERALHAMNGGDYSIFARWALPPQTELEDLDRSHGWPHEYLQSAGARGAMTIEVRRLESDGKYHQYALARADAADGETTIEWGNRDHTQPHRMTVPTDESFTSEEAAPVYAHYFFHETVPPGARLRELDGLGD